MSALLEDAPVVLDELLSSVELPCEWQKIRASEPCSKRAVHAVRCRACGEPTLLCPEHLGVLLAFAGRPRFSVWGCVPCGNRGRSFDAVFEVVEL